MTDQNSILFTTDNPDIDEDIPEVADLDAGQLQELQAAYDAVKSSNTGLKRKCTRLWKSILPHLDVETKGFKEGATEAQKASCVEHMFAIRQSVAEVNQNFLGIIDSPVVSNNDVATYDTWLGGWKDRLDTIVEPMIRPKAKSQAPKVGSEEIQQPNGPNHNSTYNPDCPHNHSSEQASFTVKPKMSLPRLKLRTFGGDYSEYHVYKAVFQSLMEDADISELQQACYLLDSLVSGSEAEKVVRYIDPVEAGALKEMWDCLDEKYDRTPLGESVYLQRLLDVSQWESCQTDESLKNLYEHVFENLHCLRKATGKTDDGDAVKGHMYRLLPERLRHKLTNLTLTEGTYSIDQLMGILKAQVVHNERNFHLGGVHNPVKPTQTKPKRHNVNNTMLQGDNIDSSMGSEVYTVYPQQYAGSTDPQFSQMSSVPVSSHGQPEGLPPQGQTNSAMIHQPMIGYAPMYPTYPYSSFQQRQMNPCAPPYYPPSCQPQSYDAMTNYARFNRPPLQRPQYNRGRAPDHWSKTNSYRGGHTSNQTPSKVTQGNPAVQVHPPVQCVFCDSKDHQSFVCRAYSDMQAYCDITWRKDLCRNCLESGHYAFDCRAERKCDLACGHTTKHCKLLCKAVQSGKMNAYSVSIMMHGHVASAPVYMQTAMANISNLDSGKSMRARFLPDSGSNKSYIADETAELLGLKVLGEFVCQMSTFGHKVESVRCKVVEFGIWYLDSEAKEFKQVRVRMMTNPQMCGKVDGIPLDDETRSAIRKGGFQLADPEVHHQGQYSIDILLGLDYYYEFVNPSFHRISRGLVLLSTKFGEVLAGPSIIKQHGENKKVFTNQVTTCIMNHVYLDSRDDDFYISPEEVGSGMKLLTDLETIGIRPPEEETSPVLQKFDDDVEFIDGRFRAKLPFIERGKEMLQTNLKGSFIRLNSCYKKLLKPGNEDKRLKYSNIIKEQVESGVIKEVALLGKVDVVQENLYRSPRYYDDKFIDVKGSTVHYLPHHSVEKKSSGKLRVVYDASAKPYKKAVSLNDCLEAGPSLINSLASILVRFRLHKYAFTADIEKAFLQIEIDPTDQEALRFLWRKGEDVYIYKFQRLPFGLKCSPFILAATLKYHLEHSNLDPVLVASILENFYVDDWLYSTQSKEDGLKLVEMVTSSLSQASFNLCKWNSNDEGLKQVFYTPAGEVPPEVESVLGMIWNTKEDTLGVASERILEKLEQENSNTKKELFSLMQTVFDPLGELSPFVLLSKKLMQRTHKIKLDWKDQLPDDILTDWKAWKGSLVNLPQFYRQRWICVPEANSYKLCGFCDASSQAYAAVVYLVSSNEHEVRSSLLISKSRVAPAKGMTIPRMELCSAVLLVNLMSAAGDMLKHIKISQKLYYTDCTSVLHWILSGHYSWGVFIANRIRQIILLSDPHDWNYVNTLENPADLPSRGCSLEELKDRWKSWVSGPRFLITGEKPYQGKMNLDFSSLPDEVHWELARSTVSYVQVKPCGLVSCVDHDRTNSYKRLMRITSTLYKAVYAFRHCKKVGKGCKVDWSDWKELPPEAVELEWVRSIQQCHFAKEIEFCKSQTKRRKVVMAQNVPSSLVRALGLFWDSETGVLRCHTRLSESTLSPTQVYPILLPKDSKFTKMFIIGTHERIGHAGVRQTLAAVKAEFYVPRCRKLVTSLLRGCFVCRRVQARTFSLPPPPSIPKSRLTVTRPFLHTGLDFAGPFTLKGGKLGYCLIFTCAVTRAVHLEAIQAMSVHGFWLGFRRFICRRGIPSLITSDNANTFKCVARELKVLLNSKKLKDYLKSRRIEWQFYIDRAPWHGGFIERVVGLFKRNFRKVVGTAILDYEEFLTFVYEAECIINSRPLTYVYDTPEGEGPLTPSLLLSGYNLTDLPPIDGIRIGRKDPQIARERLKFINKLVKAFWNRFHKEYLGELADRGFGKNNRGEVQRAPKVGEMVLVKGEKLVPRSRWKMGVVTEASSNNKDKKVRTVVVRLMGGEKVKAITEIKRSPCFLVPLEDTEDQFQA